MTAIRTRGLCRRFGDFAAVDHIDLEVPSGSFYGFLGPNGAGKSTTIRCLIGFLRPSAGEVRVLDLDPARDAVAIKRRVGVVPENLALFDRLSVVETLELVGRAHGLSRADQRQRIDELIAVLGLGGAEGTLAAELSHGMRKKTALACALLPAPELLILDEPFEGVDAVAAREIKTLLQRFAKAGNTVFMTSHVLEIVERLADRIGIVVGGRLVAQGTLADVMGERTSLEATFLGLAGAGAAAPARLDWLMADSR